MVLLSVQWYIPVFIYKLKYKVTWSLFTGQRLSFMGTHSINWHYDPLLTANPFLFLLITFTLLIYKLVSKSYITASKYTKHYSLKHLRICEYLYVDAIRYQCRSS